MKMKLITSHNLQIEKSLKELWAKIDEPIEDSER
jgi:hypothetical protein